ncbi:amidase domain-containing protein [Paenibacillus sp. M1]|uniref:Amidase domain-containing protein n=1 Tax=Paenibacillus haidiansis TaxID=1574488 RepID=A0ABU7VW77_9BACL
MRTIGKWMICMIVLSVCCLYRGEEVLAKRNKPKDEVEVYLKHVFDKRADVLVNQKISDLEADYLTNKVSRNALFNEFRRVKYINTWAAIRAIKLIDADSEIRIVRTKVTDETAVVSIVQSLKISYDYLNEIVPVQSFGIGTRHFITLKKSEGEWKIAREWYLDPLDENPDKIAETKTGVAPSVKTKVDWDGGKKFNRKQAVAYANKYAGLAWGAGNNRRYNQYYLDYTSRGGDCTNFASQVIGDKKGGGLPMTSNWRYGKHSGGTQYWVRTDSFSYFLTRSGYGKLVGKGDFQHIVEPTKEHPQGAIARLLPGDLVGYIIDGNDVDHFSVIVGFDDYGYPLVNSHTADRYRVPFDLGWDRYTKYVLIHINDE